MRRLFKQYKRPGRLTGQPKTMLADINHIQSLIPQGPPFVMIDALLCSDETTSWSSLTIREDNIFVSGGQFLEPGIVEHIAQTAAARCGYAAQQEQGPVLVGYIGAIKSLQVYRLPLTGEELKTEISVMNQVFNVTLISGKVYCQDELAAECEMKIFINKLKNN